jgi:deoxyadenosine/deoxycytidine kinase
MTYIVIEGVIGVGKTALTRLLGEQFGVQTFSERFEVNPFLNSLTLYKVMNCCLRTSGW